MKGGGCQAVLNHVDSKLYCRQWVNTPLKRKLDDYQPFTTVCRRESFYDHQCLTDGKQLRVHDLVYDLRELVKASWS